MPQSSKTTVTSRGRKTGDGENRGNRRREKTEENRRREKIAKTEIAFSGFEGFSGLLIRSFLLPVGMRLPSPVLIVAPASCFPPQTSQTR